MKKPFLIFFLAALTAFLSAQGGVSGTAEIKLPTTSTPLLYGGVVTLPVTLNLGAVTATGGQVGLGGFVLSVGFDKSKFTFINGSNSALSGTAGTNLTFVTTQSSVANSNGFFALVGATSNATLPFASGDQTAATFTGRVMALTSPNFTLDPTLSSFPQVKMSLSTAYTASNGGPSNISLHTNAITGPSMGKSIFATGDYDQDGKSDYAVFSASTGNWVICGSKESKVIIKRWQNGADCIPVPGDYEGTGFTNFAVYSPSTGYWSILKQDGTLISRRWWSGSDSIPVPADYEGVERTNLAIYSPSSGYWVVLKHDGTLLSKRWQSGTNCIPVPGKYEQGINKANFAIYVPSTGQWSILKQNGTLMALRWWTGADSIPVPANYEGLGTNVAVFSPSSGYWVIRKMDGTLLSKRWQNGTDSIPVPGYYEGATEKDNIAVYSPSTGYWSILKQDGSLMTKRWQSSSSDIAIAR